MRYYRIALLLLICFGLGWGMARTRNVPADVNVDVQELNIDLGDFNADENPTEDPWSDISPNPLREAALRS